MSSFPKLNEQMDLISRGVEEIIPEENLVKKIEKSIKEDKPMRIKLGCDPSRPDLHFGHSLVLNKLAQFQSLGHQGVLVIGDFTAMIGDPTGRNKTRPQLSMEEAKENSQSYIDQAGVILDKSSLEIVYNSDWLTKLSFNDIISISSKYTVAQMIERDDFTKRYKEGLPIALHEFMYPLAQGYDSVVLKSDVELGGTDQKFNLLVGRHLQKVSDQSPQVIITTPLLEGTDGVNKMSKSYDNYIGITENANDMYGKILSIPDNLMATYYEYLTHLSKDELDGIKKELTQNPRDLKRQLARMVVAIYHDKDEAVKAEESFDKLFIKKDIPDQMPECSIMSTTKVIDLITDNALVGSRGDAKRLIKQGAVSINGNKVSDLNFEVSKSDNPQILKAGKRKFLKII